MADNVTPIGGFSQAGAEKLREMAGNSEVFAEYLKFHGRMFKHSPSVTLEFFMQRPECRYIANIAQWERAENPVLPDSEGLRFRDSTGRVTELYDITQCENPEHTPYQWRMSESGERAVRDAMNLPAGRSLLDGLTDRATEPSTAAAVMERLGVPPEDTKVFAPDFRNVVQAIIAARLEVGGNRFPVQVNEPVMKRMADMSNEQRLGFITAAAVSAKKMLTQIEQVITDRIVMARAERMVQNEVRGVSKADGRGNAADSGRGAAGSSEGDAAQLPDAVQSDAEGRRAGLGSDADTEERRQQDILPAAAEIEADRERDLLVSGESDNRDIRDADRTGRTDDGGRTGRELRSEMDAVDGGKSSGEGRGDEILSPVSDSGTVGGQESVGVPEQTGRAVSGSESATEGLRGNGGVGENESVLHGRSDDEGHRASGSNDSVNDKIAQAFAPTDEPSTDQAGGFVMPDDKPITSERRAEMLAAFAAKHSLDGLDVFVKKDNAYAGDGRAYDLLVKTGKRLEFQAQVFTLPQGARFTEAVLQSGLAELEQSAEFQQFLSFRQGQHTLFDQPEAEKVDTYVNSEPEMDAETIAIRQREIDKAVKAMQRRLERPELTEEQRQELQDSIAFLQSEDAEHIEITAEAMDAFREKRAQERAERTAVQKPETDERRQLLLHDLDRGSGFHNGKMRIADYFAKEQPSDDEFADFMRKEYGIGGHSGPDMASVDYDGKGIHIVSADRKNSYQYTWTQAAKEIRKLIEQNAYITPADISDAVDDALYYLQEVERLDDHEREHYTEQLKTLRSHPLLTDSDRARIDAQLQPDSALKLSPAARYIMDEDNMPMFVDRMVARDEMDTIAHRILDNGEDAAAVAKDFVDASRYIISDHETFDLTTFAADTDFDGVTFTAEPDSLHPFSVSYSWEQIGSYFRAAAQLKRDVDREAEEAWERDAAENMEAYDALDHHRDVFLRDTRESEGSGYITNARKQDFYNYRLHFDPEQGCLLLADSDNADDLIIRNFTKVNSQIVLHGVQEMGFEVESVEPAFTYEIYQMKSGAEHHLHRWESLESNKYAHLTHEDYDLVYSGDLRDIEGDSVQQKLNALFEKFNTDHPADFYGHSMTTSDVIVVTEGSGRTPYYVQPVGFEVMPDFFAHKFDLIDIKFTGNPEGMNAIKVAARTDSFDETGQTNMLIADTQVFYARLSENADLADVQKVIQTAQENGCYLTADSVQYLTERFGADFMPEQDVDLAFPIPESGITVDLATTESFTLTDTFSEYEGGIDSNGHERKDNFSSHSQSCTYSYRGHGIVIAEKVSETDYPITETYNIYDTAQREKLLADMRSFTADAESLTTHSEPKVVSPVSEWSYNIVADMKTWSQNESPRSELERYDTLDAAIARFNKLRSEAYNDEAVYGENDPDLPLARLTLGIRHSSGTMEFDLIQVRGGYNMLNADYTRYEQARDSTELQEAITAVAEWCGIDSVLDYQRNEKGDYVPVIAPYEQPQAQDSPERNYVLVLNDNDHEIQFGEAFDSLEDAQDAGNAQIWDSHAVGYAVLNRQEQKIEVYDGDFPTGGVFSEEVYANSDFQNLTVHTDAPLPALHEELAQTAEPESTIQFGLLGNGITVFDTARTQPHSADYLTVAHISEEGNVQYYAEVSDSDRKRIEVEAARQLEKFTEQWNAMSDTEKLLAIMQTANPSQVAQILGDRLPADQIIAKYEKSVIFHSEDFPTNGQEAAEVAEPLTAKTLKNSPPVEAASDTPEPDSDTVDFQNADLAGFLAGRTLSSDEWEDLAYPFYDTGYLDKHQPSEKGAFGYHLSEPALYDLARRFHDGEDIRRELALGLLEGSETSKIEITFEEGKISDRTFYHPESERHTLETVKTDTGFNCYFNSTERTVSFEEIGQAFLDRIYDEFNDLAFWWVRDDLHEAFPDMTDEQMRDLIAVFDRELTPEWENTDYAPIKKALTDVLGDAEQAEKAFAIIAEGKYHVKLSDVPQETADNRPDSDIAEFVQEQNRRVLDNLAVGDQIGIGGKSWEVEKIDFDFMLTLRNPDAESSEAGRQIIGNWKQQMLQEAGNQPISVIKAAAAQQIDELTEVLERFNEHYDKLYSQHDAVEGYARAVAVGDEFIQNNADYVKEFNALRGDILSNDRETAAFAYALADCGVIEPFAEPAAETEKAAEPEKDDTYVNAEPAAPADEADAVQPEKKRGRLTRPEEIYKLLSEMYPQIISGERTHEHYEADPDSGYEPLSVEMIGDDLYSFMTYYIQNGDLMRDPDITFMLDHDAKTAHVFSFQQDGVPPVGTYYVEVADENGRVDTKLQASLEQTFLQNLKNAQFADRTLTRYHDRLGEEVVLVPDAEEMADVPEESTEPVRVDECAHLREVLNAFSEEHGLGALDIRFTAAREVSIFETYADGSDKMLGAQPYWGDNDQISPEECKEILDRFAADAQRRFRSVEEANGRKYAVQARGKSELPPVPEKLPEIVYAKAPLEKVRDNIAAIRELQRLARCEAAGEPLYDKKRNQWHCKENSDDRLRRYSGWGGLSQVFDAKSGRYAQLREELKRLLTPEEYASAKASSTDAHYTPQIIIDAMWTAVQNMGIPRDSRVLEPSCGTGNFITRMPHSIGNAGVVGVELDAITAQIAARLNADNPKVTIIQSAFEQSGQEDNSFDLVIGNIPFGDYKMNDPDYAQDWLIHDAFFRKALDKVAAGGVVAFVTSTGTMDKQNPKVREYLAQQADLIGAIRLPNTAFSDAGTGVPTDIIFLQKRPEPLSPDAPKPDWCYLSPVSPEQPDIRINTYFTQNPQMMLGTMRKTSFQDRLTCDPIEGADLKKQLENAVKQLDAKIIVTKREKAAQERRGYIQPWGKQYTFQEKDGKVYYNEGETMREVTGSAAEMDKLKRLIELRTLTRQLIDKQKTAVGDHELIPMRTYLNQQYDDFVAKYGQLNSDAVKKAFSDDADFSLLQSLEEYDSDSKTYHKAEIFSKRTVNPVMEITAVETLEEAYQVSLDRRGKPNIPYMATLLQAQYPDTPFTELTKQIQTELLEKGMVFIDPEKEIAGEEFSGIVERSEYLSGNVRRKLAYAQEMAKENPDFQRNVEALTKVIPEDIHAEEISVRLGCAWIDPEDYTKFLQELSGRRTWDTRCEVKYSPVTGEFDILQAGSRKDINVNEGTTYGTDKLTMYEIAQKLLNQRRIAVMMSVPSPKDPSKTVTRTDPVETRKAMEKAKLIEEKFAEWIFADPERKAKYERRYNDLFNSLVGRKYDGSHLTFEGQSAAFSLRPHQRDCVARAVYGGNTLAAHVVGAGKSAVFQTTVMKKKQLGLINKACVVVPKPLVEQTASEWRKLYPDAKLLTMSAADLSSEAKRDLFAARVATGDYDAVIVSMEQFEKMPMSLEFQKAYLQRQLDELEDMLRETRNRNGNRRDATTKQIESAKKKLTARLESIMHPKSKQKGKDILLDFEQLGFDYLVVDEAHTFKNGFVQSKMGNVSGVTTAPSGRAQDMQMKCDYFNEQLGQGHLLFCTGTPVSNSMTELYVMLRYLRPDLLAAAGVERFDDWAATFGKVTTQYKQTATSELKLKTAFAKFANLPELMQMYKEFADIQSAKKLDLPRPALKTGKPQIISVDASPEQKQFVRELVERARLISEGRVDPRDDNMLVITGEARLTGLCNAAVAALMRKHEMEVPEGFADAKTSKVDECVKKVAEIYGETTEQKGVQIIFSDVAVNSDDGNFSVYDYIRRELIASGIPADEIIYAPKSDAKNREDIFRDINAGKYRVVIASTGTLGTGANVQERLAAVHHVDVPWKPSDLEQREGRILRQGNTFSEVQIFNYITKGTMDSYLYQIVTDKARFIAQLLDDETPARVSEDCDDKVLTYGEMQAAAEGNPNFRKRIELGMKVSELEFAKAEFQRETGEMRRKIAVIPDDIQRLRERISGIEQDIAKIDRMRSPEGKIDSLTVTTARGKTLTKRDDINQFLHGLLYQKQKNPFDDVPAFKIGDFTVSVQMDGSQEDFAFVVQGESPVTYRASAELHEKSDNVQRLMNLLSNGVPNEKARCENRIEKLNADMDQAKERLEVEFPHEQELHDAREELAKVEAELLGITQMEDAILDPEEEPLVETAEEKFERESFAQSDDDNDLNPNTSGDTLPPPIAPRM